MFRRRSGPGRGSVPMPPPHPEELWKAARSERGDILYRFNATLRPFAGRTDHTIRIGIALPARNPSGHAFPDDEEVAEWDATEDTVIAAAGDRARLVVVITAFAFREYVLYTPSGDWIPRFHEELNQAITTHEVQVVAETDPRWTVYKAVAGG